MAINSRAEKTQNEAGGEGFSAPIITVSASSNTTAASQNSGNFSLSIRPNAIGTTLPNTIESLRLPPSPTNDFLVSTLVGGSTTVQVSWLAWIYEIGTQVVTATGNQFTHHAATFPLLRTVMGVANQPIALLPMYQVTTATTVAAAVLTIKTVANTAGYTDQDGNATVGSRTFTMPSTATTINSCFMPRLEDGDSGVRDINAIQTNTNATAGAVRVWGVELLMPASPMGVVSTAYGSDGFYGGIKSANLRPAVATSGTANAKLVILSTNATGANSNWMGHYTAVRS